MLDSYINEIYDLLVPVVPRNTKRIVLFGIVTDTTHQLEYYVKPDNETTYDQCFELCRMTPPRADINKVRSAFRKIA